MTEHAEDNFKKRLTVEHLFSVQPLHEEHLKGEFIGSFKTGPSLFLDNLEWVYVEHRLLNHGAKSHTYIIQFRNQFQAIFIAAIQSFSRSTQK